MACRFLQLDFVAVKSFGSFLGVVPVAAVLLRRYAQVEDQESKPRHYLTANLFAVRCLVVELCLAERWGAFRCPLQPDEIFDEVFFMANVSFNLSLRLQMCKTFYKIRHLRGSGRKPSYYQPGLEVKEEEFRDYTAVARTKGFVEAVLARRDDLLKTEGVVQGLIGSMRVESGRLRRACALLLCRQIHLARQVLCTSQSTGAPAEFFKAPPGLQPPGTFFP